VSIIDHLAGGGGRVLADVVKALPDRSHLVLCGDGDAYLGIALRDELETTGAAIRTIGSKRQLRSFLEQARPEMVIQHWWPNRLLSGPLRLGHERWIAYGHSGLSLPDGYDAYVVVSDYHRRFQGHLPPERVHCIPNAVDRSLFRPRRTARSGPVTIVMLSRLDTGKFPRRLLDYLPSLPDLGARLVVAGRGRRRHEIEPELEGRGLRKVVRFCGALPSHAVPDFMCRADIGLHLNEAVSESGSIAIKQMLAAGIPVVAQPEGCVPELVVDGRNGFLARDERAVAERLRELILSPSLRRRMGAASLQRAEAFDAEHFRKAVRTLMEDLAGHPARASGRGGTPFSRSSSASVAT
jgi:glycosyltransferase involved in cell wall biosynthesis